MEKKYYELMKNANNAVGAVFAYCTEEELEAKTQEFQPDYTDTISKEEYDEEIKRQNRKFMRMATGYPK
ncbi:hypothetical protein D3C71_1332740 [compost metagenome]